MHSALAGLFRTRQRKDNGWDNYDREIDLLIATMVETILRERPRRKGPVRSLLTSAEITSGMIASDVQMQGK